MQVLKVVKITFDDKIRRCQCREVIFTASDTPDSPAIDKIRAHLKQLPLVSITLAEDNQLYPQFELRELELR